jgi:hypothetical protein
MELRNVGKRFEITFTRDDGRRFKGFIYAPPASQTKSTTFITARRILKVSDKSDVKEGDVFKLPNGTYGLCFDMQDGYFYEPNFHLFGLVTLDQNLSWKRKTLVEDPVTLRMVSGEPEDLGFLRCVTEYVRQDEDSLKVPGSVFRLLCGKEIKEGDLLGEEFVVKKVYKILGIYMAYV